MSNRNLISHNLSDLIEEIKTKDFLNEIQGYNRGEVDDFLDTIISKIENTNLYIKKLKHDIALLKDSNKAKDEIISLSIKQKKMVKNLGDFSSKQGSIINSNQRLLKIEKIVNEIKKIIRNR